MSIGISLIAIGMARSSSERMRALTDLNFDEKMAMMARYKRESELKCVYYDFRAISHLRCWADPQKKKELIEGYVIPIIKDAQSRDTGENNRDIICKIITIAREIDPKNEDLKKLQQEARCL